MSNHRFIFLTLIIAFLLPYTYGGCGGGGGGGGDDEPTGMAPSISWVHLTRNGIPTHHFTIGDKSNVELEAFDEDFDMSKLFVEQFLLPNEDTPYYDTAEIPLPTQTYALMRYYMIEDTTIVGPAGTWLICFWIVDQAGNESSDRCIQIMIKDNEAKAFPASNFTEQLNAE